MISIKGLDKAKVLAALYNNSYPMGMGMWQARPGNLSVEDARKLLESDVNPDYPGKRRGMYFDYLYGRVLKVDLTGDEFDERLYDRDLGKGAAQRVIESIK